MKKYILISIIVLSFLILKPVNVFATSGTCSSHGGVNCSKVNADGNAICNDGYKSSVSYFLMDECINTSNYTWINNPCSSLFPISEFAEYTQSIISVRPLMQTHIQGFIDQEKSAIDTINSTVATDIQEITQKYQSAISSWQSAEQNAIAGFQARYYSMNSEGSGSDFQTNTDSIKNQYEPKIQSLTTDMNSAIAQQQTDSSSSIASDNTCINSLTALLTKMQSAENYCSTNYGTNSVPDTDLLHCTCASGYTMANNQCVIQAVSTPQTPVVAPQPAPTSTVQTIAKTIKIKVDVPSNLLKTENQTAPILVSKGNVSQPPMKTNDQICQDSYGLNSKWNDTKVGDKGKLACDCKIGYQLNDSNTLCVASILPIPQKEGFFKSIWHFFTNLF